MQRMFYAGAVLLVPDQAAEALLEFAALIANAGKAERIEVPIVGTDGRLGAMQVVVGPSSQIVAVPTTHEEPDPDVSTFLDELTARSRRYREASAVIDPVESADWDDLE